MSEKITDMLMLNKYKIVFFHEYHTENNKKIFKNNIPDGWDILDNKILIIIENKRDINKTNEAKKQILKYYNEMNEEYKNMQIYLILSFGISEENFIYKIFNKDLQEVNETLETIKNSLNIVKSFDIKNIHKVNQFMYDRGINIPKSQKTLFIASILICLKIDNNFINDFNESSNSYNIASKILKTIDEYYNDKIFTNSFDFILKSIHNKHLYKLFKIINNNITNYGNDILNLFYSEFCLWDRNDDAALGVVLTPADIVEMMVEQLHIKDNETVLDFCTGTGSFLVEAGKYTKYLFGCENNSERYALAKCNFILRNYNYDNLIYNSCFDYNYKTSSFDKIIINPPFGNCKGISELNKHDSINWKNYNNERKFLMYALELLKIGGRCACIIPMSNFSNGSKQIEDFKKEFMKDAKIIKTIKTNSKVFEPHASPGTTIIIFEKIEHKNEPLEGYKIKLYDYSDDGYIIKNKVRIKEREANIKHIKKEIFANSNWNYNEINDIDNNELTERITQQYINNINYSVLSIKILLQEYIKDHLNNLSRIKIKLSDIFEIMKSKTYKTNEESGIYPLYGATQENIPVSYINKYSIDADEIDIKGVVCINKTGNGGAGLLHKRKGKFAINSTVWILKYKQYINDVNLSYISIQLHKIFNRANSLNETKFNEIEIYIFDENVSNFNKFEEFGKFMNELGNKTNLKIINKMNDIFA